MEGTNMLIRVIITFYLFGDIRSYEPPPSSECSAVIKEPLQSCTNFSTKLRKSSELKELRDSLSRTNRRAKICNETLVTRYNRLRPKRSRRDVEGMPGIPDTDKKWEWNYLEWWASIQTMMPTKNITGNLSNCSSGCSEPDFNPCNILYLGLVVDLMPFSYQMIETISNMFNRCCGDYAVLCASSTLLQLSQLDKQSIQDSDIVFPVIVKSSKKRMHGYHFAPVYDAPSAYHFTSKQSKESVSNNIAKACQHLWPLLTICLLLAVISGFVAWSIESHVNEEEFPRAFHVGLFEGFWWSFISMTTVGYGDKAPKSIAGRLFSMIWILVGITVCSMFTASLTTEITERTTPATPTMSGKPVAVLKYRLLDALIVAEQGGIIREVEHNNVSEGVEKMIEMLHNHDVSGFVLDTLTYHYFLTLNEKEITRTKVYDLLHTDVDYNDEKLSIGVLFKDSRVFEFFNNYFTENQLYLKACHYLQMNAQMIYPQEEAFLFNPDGGLFYTILYYIIGVLVLIFIFGTLYELRRNRIQKITLKQLDSIQMK